MSTWFWILALWLVGRLAHLLSRDDAHADQELHSPSTQSYPRKNQLIFHSSNQLEHVTATTTTTTPTTLCILNRFQHCCPCRGNSPHTALYSSVSWALCVQPWQTLTHPDSVRGKYSHWVPVPSHGLPHSLFGTATLRWRVQMPSGRRWSRYKLQLAHGL